MTAADVIAGEARWSVEQSDALEWLRLLPDGCVNTCVTSPPYFGLRDYGTGTWEGGDAGCDHVATGRTQNLDKLGERMGCGGGKKSSTDDASSHFYCDSCGKCGAARIDQQIGLEPTPDEYVSKLVAVFREVRRVLRDDGTLWMNLGDSYANDGKFGGETGGKQSYLDDSNRKRVGREKRVTGLKPKDLIGIPWLVAFALRADGWTLRQDIIWHKPNPMPESVTDRCTKSHEYLFLLSKSPRYYFDPSAIAEPCTESNAARPRMGQGPNTQYAQKRSGNKAKTWGVNETTEREAGDGSVETHRGIPWEGSTRNKRSVWTVSTRPYAGAHFAVFPPELIEPCVRAGCPDDGIVLETFTGSGTTGMVALDCGRRFIGCELNPAYVALASERLARTTPAMFAV